MTIQVQICQQDGGDVSLDDCASFSKPMGEAIEASHLFDESYLLEISSPGIPEDLINDRDFVTFRGFPVEVIFRNEKNSEIHRTGLLHQRTEDHVHLNMKGKMSLIPRQDVIGVRLTSPTG